MSRNRLVATAPFLPSEQVAFTPDEEIERDAEEAQALIDAPKLAAERETNDNEKIIRALEELVQVLFAKNVIQLNDFPPAIQQFIIDRKNARDELESG